MTRYIAVWLVGTEYCNYCRGPARKQQLRNSEGGPNDGGWRFEENIDNNKKSDKLKSFIVIF